MQKLGPRDEHAATIDVHRRTRSLEPRHESAHRRAMCSGKNSERSVLDVRVVEAESNSHYASWCVRRSIGSS